MGKKKPNEGTVAWLKQELEKLGVNPEDFKDMRKQALEALYSKTSGSGANAGSPTAAQIEQTANAVAVAAGAPAVTEAAADAGVDPTAAPKTRSKSSPQSKRAARFLKNQKPMSKQAISGTNVVVGKKGVRISPPKHGKGQKMHIEKGFQGGPQFPPPLPPGMAPLDFSRKKGWKEPWKFGVSRLRSPPSPRGAEVTFTNIYPMPVMLKASYIPPEFNPRKEAIYAIPGHENALDPGTSLTLRVPTGCTIYAHDDRMNLCETITTARSPNEKPTHTLHGLSSIKAGQKLPAGFSSKISYWRQGKKMRSKTRSKSPKGRKKKGGTRRRVLGISGMTFKKRRGGRRTRRRRRRRQTRRRVLGISGMTFRR